MNMFRILATTAALVATTAALAGCAPERPLVETPAAEPSGRFDALSVTLVIDTPQVRSGEELPGRLIVENPSQQTVVDPACVLPTGRHALVPVDQPDAELWLQPIADCGGPLSLPPGYYSEYEGLSFFARTKYGDPLAPGDYLAAVEIDGLSTRLEVPVTVLS
jgi:hypothetical protein